MTRTVALALGCIAASFVAAAYPSDVAASVLCQVRKKALVVRDVCKPREELLTPARQEELGLRGPSGPAGPPGPSTGGLRVIDAVGREVGLVTGETGYYGSVQIVTELTLPGRSAPEFVVGEVDGTGLQKDFNCRDAARLYKTPTCTGQAYSDCRDGECALTPGEFFAQPIFYQSSATGCFYGDPSEAELADVYRRTRFRAASPSIIAQSCQFSGGTLMGVPTPCLRPGFYCGECCFPASTLLVIPVHPFDQSLLGTPTFRLSP